MNGRSMQEYRMAVAAKADRWVPANGGTEFPFRTRSGKRLLYCYNPHEQRHAYMDVDTDMLVTDEEARAHLGV